MYYRLICFRKFWPPFYPDFIQKLFYTAVLSKLGVDFSILAPIKNVFHVAASVLLLDAAETEVYVLTSWVYPLR